MEIKLEKYHALGNDYFVLDPNKYDLPLQEHAIQTICHRNFGFGSDGILLGPIFEEGAVRVKIYNPDGGEAEKSGNGVRIFSRYLKDFGYIKQQSFTLTTLGGPVEVEYLDAMGSSLKVQMGKATFQSEEIPVAGEPRMVVDEEMEFHGQRYRATCLSVGNPHCVIPMEQVSKALAMELGPYVENAPYFPNRINMQIMQVHNRNKIQIEIYERGAGYTLSSGSSSCAAACAAYRLGLTDREMEVCMPGGTIGIAIDENGFIYMTGGVSRIGTVLLCEEFLDSL